MTWIKLLIAGLIIALSTLLGYVAAGRFRARGKFFAQMCAFNERFVNELSYGRKPLSEIAADQPSGDFGKLLSEAAAFRVPDVRQAYLTKEEKQDVTDYFSLLGRGDSYSQIGFFTAKKTALSEKKAAAEKEAASRSSLYLKLGLLAGLALVILIV